MTRWHSALLGRLQGPSVSSRHGYFKFKLLKNCTRDYLLSNQLLEGSFCGFLSLWVRRRAVLWWATDPPFINSRSILSSLLVCFNHPVIPLSILSSRCNAWLDMDRTSWSSVQGSQGLKTSQHSFNPQHLRQWEIFAAWRIRCTT